jgi:hypothetical protein
VPDVSPPLRTDTLLSFLIALFCFIEIPGQRCVYYSARGVCFSAAPCPQTARAQKQAAPAPLRRAPATSAARARRKPVAEFVTELRNLTPKDITAVVGKMLKSPISVAAIGDITDIPRYNELTSRFG